jgi:glycosyltransferase involved in cell wall biosynthesis
MVQVLAEVADVTVVVSSDHRESLQRWQASGGDPRLRFVFVDVPRIAPTIRRSRLCSRQMWFLTYLLWSRAAAATAQRLEAEQPFDAAVHVAYASYWVPSPVVDLQAPSVWGPVGGGTATPSALWRFLGLKGVVNEIEKLVSVYLASWYPATRRTWRRATVRMVETQNTRRRIPARLRADTYVANRAVFANTPPLSAMVRNHDLLFPSALVARKGPRLAVAALAQTPPGVRMHFVTDGPERPVLERMAKRLGVADRLEFHGWVPRQEMFSMMASVAAVVYTGLREEGGLTLAEAMMLGAPVIVLGHGGARELAEANTDPSRVAIVEPGRADATIRALAERMAAFSADPPTATGPYLDQETTIRTIHEAVRQAMGRSRVDAVAQEAAG